MTLVRLFLAFVLTLLLFWAAPRFNEQRLDIQYFDSASDRYLIDHTAVGRHSTASDPEITVWVNTPADTSTFGLALHFRTQDDSSYLTRPLTRVAGSYDLFSTTIPRLIKGQSYNYHIELQTSAGKVIARLPEESGSEIRLLFEGKPGIVVWAVYLGIMFLAAMYGFLALFDAVRLGANEVKLKQLSRKVLAAVFLFTVGGVIVGGMVSSSRFGYIWGAWPFGGNKSETLIETLIIFWLALTVLFKGTIFRFRPEKNLVSPGAATVLTLIGILFMITVYLAGDHFVGIPL